MCSLFGIIDYGNVLSAHEKNRILAVLSRECEVRGTDATGIAYNFRNNIHVYKRPVAARKMHFRIPNGVNVVMGHTRMATQGAAKLNRNNHPWATPGFALAHNGVLWNDRILREIEELPHTLIETDSYIAVQLLEKQKPLNFQTIQEMAEKVQGSFVFTILDRQDNLYFVRGDNPLAIFCYDDFYLYASTEMILDRAEKRLGLRHGGEITTREGDILRVDRQGHCLFSGFCVTNPYSYWESIFPYWDELEENAEPSSNYLIDVAKAMGVSPEDVRLLLRYGCSAGEVEELLYDPRLLHDIVSEIRCDWYGEEVLPWDWVKS